MVTVGGKGLETRMHCATTQGPLPPVTGTSEDSGNSLLPTAPSDPRPLLSPSCFWSSSSDRLLSLWERLVISCLFSSCSWAIWDSRSCASPRHTSSTSSSSYGGDGPAWGSSLLAAASPRPSGAAWGCQGFGTPSSPRAPGLGHHSPAWRLCQQ